MSPPPAKRRRTSSPRPLLSPHLAAAGSPPPRPTTRPCSPPVPRRNGRRNPLDGFNDEEEAEHSEDDVGEGATGSTRTSSDMDHQPQSHDDQGQEEEEEEEEHCAICLSPIENRAVVSPCHHGQFCWGCIRAWTDQSRKCPLCLGPIEHLIHNIRSAKDYQNHYLLPLPTASSSDFVATFPPPRARGGSVVGRSQIGAAPMNPTLPRHALYGRQSRTSRFSSSNRVDERDEATWREREQERALERRRYIYREGLYAKHVASNRYTGFKPFSPHTFSKNEELKAKVIKFIRRELQVFPAVDVAFLTTYLVTIASQLDLRSPSAIRLISDFLSERDAQHLVHEISTFARSPFTSLEGYDRFVQYGRPQRRRHDEEEEEEEGSISREAAHKPRFEEHMSRRREQEEEEEEEEKGRRRSTGGPPLPSSTARDSSRGYARSGRSPSPPPLPPSATLPRRYSSSGSAPNGSRPPPPPPPHHPRRSYRPIEPNWRERDQRYTGSYYATAVSEGRRGDGGGGGGGGGRRGRRGGFVGSTASRMSDGGGGPAFSAADEEDGGGGRRRYDSRGRRRRSPSLSLALPRRDSVSPPPPRRRRRRYSEDDDDDNDDGWPSRRRFSPAPLPRSYKDERETSPLPSSETRYQGSSRSPPSPRSRSPARPRSGSRSKTPLQRPEPLSPLPSPPPPPPPAAVGPAGGGGPAIDSELDDAISLVGPSFSIGPGSSTNSPLPSPLTATAAVGPLPTSSTFDTSAPPPRPPPPRGKLADNNNNKPLLPPPTLTIFGAARRLLGNGRIVTLARDGRASLQPQSDVFRNAGSTSGPRPPTGSAAGANAGPRQPESYYGRGSDPNRPTAFSSSSPATSAMLGPSRKPLLGRLGGIVPPPPISTISTAPVPSASSRDEAASPTTPTSSKATSPADSLRAKLHARLTAEYRQALASSRSHGVTALPSASEDPDVAVPTTATTTTTTPTPTTNNKPDLRSLLQARLQAEKALAYEDLVRTRAAASLASARDAQPRADEPTVFSQETRDLLMARLDEERRFVDEEEEEAGRPAWSASASYDTYEYGNDLNDGYYDYASSDHAPVFLNGHAGAEVGPNESKSVGSPSSSSAAPAPAASATSSKSESSLKAALLAKRRATIQNELKKFSGELKEKEMRQKLMMQKRRSGTAGGGGAGSASAEAQVRADP